ncbi:MAG TPA: GNAT family N-acetyltransferase [Yinghuangia sp.]|uniref:GNAT family N-acetyltransferase n=1 Tax=Yinghuangia sp. YIM S10712 TaxID=3436930 RepID=UPI002BDA3B3B|nr:GNAT family N-acetyltransferase [Yinghuangia sp.]
MTHAEWSLERFEADGAAERLGVLRDLYAEVYAEEPYNEGPEDVANWIGETFPRHMAMPGFAAVLARTVAGTPAGFGYGMALPEGSRWWSGMLEPLPPEDTAETGERTFVIIEFVVRASYRRSGLGRAMHSALVSPWRGERTSLTERPDAPAAVAFWDALGYKPLGPSRPWPEAPLYTMMRRDHTV